MTFVSRCVWMVALDKNRWEKEERIEQKVRERVEKKSLEQGKSCAKMKMWFLDVTSRTKSSWRMFEGSLTGLIGSGGMTWLVKTRPGSVRLQMRIWRKKVHWHHFRFISGLHPTTKQKANPHTCAQKTHRKPISFSFSLLFRCKVPFYEVRAQLDRNR